MEFREQAKWLASVGTTGAESHGLRLLQVQFPREQHPVAKTLCVPHHTGWQGGLQPCLFLSKCWMNESVNGWMDDWMKLLVCSHKNGLSFLGVKTCSEFPLIFYLLHRLIAAIHSLLSVLLSSHSFPMSALFVFQKKELDDIKRWQYAIY
jgi:hypothetical protein